MLNEIFREAQRTLFVCGIHLLFLLCLNPETPCDKQKAAYSKLTGLTRLMVNFFDQGTFFMCHYFIPYVGYMVIALQYWFLINVIYSWYCPSLVKGLRYGTFGDSDDYSVQNDKRLMRELRKMIVLILKGICGTVDTSLSPIEIHFLRTWELRTVRKKGYDTWTHFVHPTVSLLYNSLDPRSEFLRFGTTYDGATLSLIISDEKFSRKNDFFLFAMKWTMDMIQGVRYLHDQDLYHLCLLPENIQVNFGPKFLPASSKAVIGNFQSKKNNPVKYMPFGVIGFASCYKPPEAYLSRPGLPKKADAEKRYIWSIGIIVLELLTGGMLTLQTKHYFALNRMNVLAHILQSNHFFAAVEAAHGDARYHAMMFMEPEHEETGADMDEDSIWSWWMLVKDLLKFDPSSRIGIREAYQHGFVKKAENVLTLKVMA